MSPDDFCGGPIWNNSEFMTASWPKFTECFRETILVWFPCGLLTIFGPCYVAGLRNSRPNKSLPIGVLNSGKLFCHITMAILTLITMLQKASLHSEGKFISLASFLGDIIKIITFVCIAILGQYERIHGVAASILQLTFWLFMSISLLISSYTYI
ncbi:unnamed protein product, partial [Lymnaea stagnalis]